jgi:hypothetical protein
LKCENNNHSWQPLYYVYREKQVPADNSIAEGHRLSEKSIAQPFKDCYHFFRTNGKLLYKVELPMARWKVQNKYFMVSHNLRYPGSCPSLLRHAKREKRPRSLPATGSVVTASLKDVPVAAEYVAQTQSSHLVNIQARVSGFSTGVCTPRGRGERGPGPFPDGPQTVQGPA